MRSTLPRRLAVAVATLAASTLGVAAATPASATQDHTPRYYLALGDSLAAGFQTTPNGGYEVGHGYAQDIAHTLAARAARHHQAFGFTDLGCPGETTGSMINGGCPFPHPYSDSQLAEAVTFLKKHHNARIVVTIDIGANDVDGCAAGGNLDPQCVVSGIGKVHQGLDTILHQLKAAAGPHTKIVGMNLYDPFLAAWMTGDQGKTLAGLSVPLADTLNATIDATDAAHCVPTADVGAAFSTNAFAPLVPLGGQQVPLNVARIMQWTNMSRGDIHANDTGYEVIADTFLAKF